MADITGSVRSRIKVNTVTSTARAAITANATAPARPGSARILSAQPCPRKCREASAAAASSDRRVARRGLDRRPLDRVAPGLSVQMRRASRYPGRHRAAFAVARRAVLFAWADRSCGDRQNRRARRRRAALLWINPRLWTSRFGDGSRWDKPRQHPRTTSTGLRRPSGLGSPRSRVYSATRSASAEPRGRSPSMACGDRSRRAARGSLTTPKSPSA